MANAVERFWKGKCCAVFLEGPMSCDDIQKICWMAKLIMGTRSGERGAGLHLQGLQSACC